MATQEENPISSPKDLSVLQLEITECYAADADVDKSESDTGSTTAKLGSPLSRRKIKPFKKENRSSPKARPRKCNTPTENKLKVSKSHSVPLLKCKYYYFDEVNSSNTCRRRIVIAWRKLSESKLEYGACIWRINPSKDRCVSWDKKAHRQTAEDRLNKYPVSVTLVDSSHPKKNTFDSGFLYLHLRNELYTKGVKGKPRKSPSASKGVTSPRVIASTN